MEKTFPLRFCISFSRLHVMSCPQTLMLPFLILALGGSSFMMLLHSMLFPHPDSPTIASTSPFFKEKDTSLTACTSPAGLSILTERFFTSNNCSISVLFLIVLKRGTICAPSHFLVIILPLSSLQHSRKYQLRDDP